MADDTFLALTLPHLPAVYRVACHVEHDRWLAEDLVQETFLRAFAAFGVHRPEHVRAWLVSICLNVARDEARRRRRRPAETLVAEPIEWAVDDFADGVFDQATAALDRHRIGAALAMLPAAQRQSIVFMDVVGLTAAETAEVLDCPRGTVLARVHRGRRTLAALLTERAAAPEQREPWR